MCPEDSSVAIRIHAWPVLAPTQEHEDPEEEWLEADHGCLASLGSDARLHDHFGYRDRTSRRTTERSRMRVNTEPRTHQLH